MLMLVPQFVLAQVFLWEKSYSSDLGYFTADYINVTTDGEFLIAGENGTGVAHLSKVERQGELRWTSTAGVEDQPAYALGCYEKSAEVYRLVAMQNISVGIGGGAPKSTLIRDYDASGDSIFEKFDVQSGNVLLNSRAVSIESDGFRVFSNRFGANPPMLAVGYLDGNGTLQRYDDVASPDTDSLQTYWSASSLTDGSLVVAGQIQVLTGQTQLITLIKIDKEGQLVWDKRFAPGRRNNMRAMTRAENGDFLITSNVVIGDTDIIQVSLMRISPDGELLWSKVYEVRELAGVRSIVETKEKSIVLVGTSGIYDSNRDRGLEGSYDGFILHTRSDGELLWESKIGEEDVDDVLSSVYEIDNGNFLVGGTVNNGQMYLAEIDIYTSTNVEEKVENENTFNQTVFPQPASSATGAEVEFSLASAGNVLLAVFDTFGRKVTDLHFGKMESGLRRISLPLSELGRGTYYYVLSVGNKQVHGNFIVL